MVIGLTGESKHEPIRVQSGNTIREGWSCSLPLILDCSLLKSLFGVVFDDRKVCSLN